MRALTVDCGLLERRVFKHKKAPNLVSAGLRKDGGVRRPLFRSSGVRLPSAAQRLVDGDDPAIQVDLGQGLGVFSRQTLALGIQ